MLAHCQTNHTLLLPTCQVNIKYLGSGPSLTQGVLCKLQHTSSLECV